MNIETMQEATSVMVEIVERIKLTQEQMAESAKRTDAISARTETNV